MVFGYGIHMCLGAPLTGAEAQIAFATLLRRIPNPRLTGDEVSWGGTFILRGLKRLSITF